MVEWRVLHIISLGRTFDQSLMNIFPRVRRYYSNTNFKAQTPYLQNLTLNRHGWAMRSAHQPAKANICPKYNENPSKGKGDMERTWNSMKFNCDWTLSLHCLVRVYVHRLPEVNIWPSLNALPSKGNRNVEGVQNSKFLNSWPSIVTLTFRGMVGVMGSAHRLTDAKIWPKFNENSTKMTEIWSGTKFKAKTRDLQLWPWPWVSMVEL